MIKTNWDEYYNTPSFLSKYTRNLTASWLSKNISEQFYGESINVAEFGGGNSCFYESIINLEKVNIEKYTIFDKNQVGINKFHSKHYLNTTDTITIQTDLLSYSFASKSKYDLVFSVGLIEHFDIEGTKKMIEQHFNSLKQGGIVIITAPTPTLIYKTIRVIAEVFHIWKFHDERPLMPREIKQTLTCSDIILKEQMLYFTGLTQYAIIIKNITRHFT